MIILKPVLTTTMDVA